MVNETKMEDSLSDFPAVLSQQQAAFNKNVNTLRVSSWQFLLFSSFPQKNHNGKSNHWACK